MSAVRDRVYQTSDLSGAARREFLEDGVRGRAYLRTPEGESLVLTRTANLDLLSTLRDHFLSHLVLTSALTRPREERRGADFGEWAFMSNFDDDAIAEFQAEMSDALVQAISGRDTEVVDNILGDWRRSARAYADPTTRALLTGPFDEAEFEEVSFSTDGSAT